MLPPDLLKCETDGLKTIVERVWASHFQGFIRLILVHLEFCIARSAAQARGSMGAGASIEDREA